MALINDFKKKYIGEVVSMSDLENHMAENGLFLVETEDDDESVIKFSTGKSQMLFEYETDENLDMLITNIKRITKMDFENTKGDPFKSYEDMMLFQNYFFGKKWYHHWLAGWIMVSEGRRIGDTLNLKWKDFFNKNGTYKRKLDQLVEEKTGKVVAPFINALCKYYIDEYLKITEINPLEHMDEQIFKCGKGAFQKAFREAYSVSKLDYRITPHSYRKYYGNTLYKLHPQEANSIKIVQFTLGHSSEETTKVYIGQIDEDIERYNNDLSEYFLAKKDGVNVEISNSPIVSLQADKFRDILSELWELADSGMDKFEAVNKAIGMAEDIMI